MHKIIRETCGLLRSPVRGMPLAKKVASDKLQITFQQRHLYSFTKTKYQSSQILNLVTRWILDAQRADGGVPAYYSLLSGYAQSYPEVTGYIIPTLYDCSLADSRYKSAAQRATQWLVSLQISNGAFPGGLQSKQNQPSIFNTGQILQGLVRGYTETGNTETLKSALAAGDWLIEMQQSDGSWSGPGAYQNVSHTYYTMVAWALADLSRHSGQDKFGIAAEANLDWALSRQHPSGWMGGIHLQGHPNYLHFIAYVLQGALECAILRRRNDAIDAIAKSAWVLLRRFETNKCLAGAYETDFKAGSNFTCVTGNAQMACVWLRLFEMTRDLRFLNAALKMNELLKELIPQRGRVGITGGVAGSYPIWGRYQPFRYISWGCKFVADALILEQRMMRSLGKTAGETLACAS